MYAHKCHKLFLEMSVIKLDWHNLRNQNTIFYGSSLTKKSSRWETFEEKRRWDLNLHDGSASVIDLRVRLINLEIYNLQIHICTNSRIRLNILLRLLRFINHHHHHLNHRQRTNSSSSSYICVEITIQLSKRSISHLNRFPREPTTDGLEPTNQPTGSLRLDILPLSLDYE